MSKLWSLFPDKQYTGVDISSEFIELARANLSGLPVQLRAQDYFAVTGVYDFVIMRLFWQHLPQSRFDEALSKLTDITAPGSSVLITDAYDEARCFVPALPEFQKVIAAYTSQQSTIERSRDVVGKLTDWVQITASWRVGCDMPLILPSSIPGYLRLYHGVYELWIDLFECLGELDMDFAPAREELARWRNDARAYTQAGLRVVRLDRVG